MTQGLRNFKNLLLWDLFWQIISCLSLASTDLFSIALNNNGKYEGNETRASKNDKRNLLNFYQSWLESLKIGTFIWSFYPNQKMCKFKYYRWDKCNDNEEWFYIWRRLDLLVQNWIEEFNKFWLKDRNLKNLLLWNCFCQSI